MWIPRYRSPIGVLPAVLAAMGVGDQRTPGALTMGAGAPEFMASASDALHRWLASNPSAGTVVLPAYTCIRVVQAITHAGWRCAFVDVDRATLEMHPGQVASVLASGTEKPLVVLATHLHGMPVPVARLRQLTADAGALLVEDCAMALGAEGIEGAVGSTGDAAIHSFGLGKAVSLGVGGVLVAPDRPPRRAVASVRAHGLVVAAVLSRSGLLGELRMRLQDRLRRAAGLARGAADGGFTPAELGPASTRFIWRLLSDAAVIRDLQAKRARSAVWLDWIRGQGAGRIGTFVAAPEARPCCPAIPLLVEDRAVLADALVSAGVDVATYFDYCAADLGGAAGDFAGARWIAAHILLLPNDARLDAKADLVRRILIDHARRR